MSNDRTPQWVYLVVLALLAVALVAAIGGAS